MAYCVLQAHCTVHCSCYLNITGGQDGGTHDHHHHDHYSGECVPHLGAGRGAGRGAAISWTHTNCHVAAQQREAPLISVLCKGVNNISS